MAAIKKLLKKSYTVKDVNALMTESLFRPVNGKTLGEKDAAKAIVKVAAQTGANVSPAVVKMAALKANPAPKRKTAARTQRAAEAYVRRPSQITKKAPSKRLKTRRTKNLQSPRGVFPNPKARFSWKPFGTPENISYAASPGKGIDFYIHKSSRGGYFLDVEFKDRERQRYKFGSVIKAKEAAKGIFYEYSAKNNPDSVHFDIDVNSHNARGAKAKTRVNPSARKKQIIVEYELSGQNFAKRNRGMYGWKELATFPDTPEGSENAIQYAQAYHRIAPHLRIQVVTK